MIVTCKECDTRFRVDEKIVDSRGSQAQCSICDNVFTIYPHRDCKSDDKDEENFFGNYGAKSDKKKKSALLITLIVIIPIICGVLFGLRYFGEDIPFLKKISVFQNFLDKIGGISDISRFEISTFDLKTNIVDNREIGKLFVIMGTAKNGYPEARSFIRINAKLYTADNKLARTKSVFCGNIVSDQDLSTLTIEEIEKILDNPSGDNNKNVGIESNGEIPFMVVFSNYPDNPDKFEIEVEESIKTDKR